MAANFETLNRTLDGDRRAAFVVALGGYQGFLNEYFISHCWPIMGNPGVRYDKHGNIWYRRWPDLGGEANLAEFHQVYPPASSNADISAPNTRYKDKKQGQIIIVEADGGRVEAVMRTFQHIITGITKREVPQAESMVEIAAGLSLFYHGKTPLEVSSDEYEEASSLMYQSLGQVDLDPQTLVSKQKQRIMYWIPKGLTNTDDKGHLNDLISKLARGAAVRESTIRLHKLEDRMLAKYIRGLGDLEAQRAVERFICSSVVEKLAKPDEVFSPLLGTMIHQLTRFVHLNGLKPVASKAADILGQAKDLKDRRLSSEVDLLRLLPQARALLSEELAIGEQLMAKLQQMQAQG